MMWADKALPRLVACDLVRKRCTKRVECPAARTQAARLYVQDADCV